MKVRVPQWLALQTGKRGDSGSIPAKVKTFFGLLNSKLMYFFKSKILKIKTKFKIFFFAVESEFAIHFNFLQRQRIF